MIKTIANKLFISGSLVFITCFSLFGQNQQVQNTPQEWVGAYLNVAGSNQNNGVELNTKLVRCGEKNVLLLKFTNHNDYPVEIEWADAIYTSDKQWKHDERQSKEKIIIIQAKEEKAGECGSQEVGNQLLTVEIKGIIENAENFAKYAPSYFVVIEKK